MLNWIADINTFHAPQPPDWFLKAMWDQDAELVILPSRVRRAYILARRKQQMLRVPMLNASYNDLLRRTRGSDGDLLATHNLQMIDYINGNLHGSWSPAILADLKDRDMWAAGGGEKYADKLEAQEEKVATKKRKDLVDNIEHRAGDAWRSYQARTGSRNQRAGNSSGAKIVHVGTL